MMAMTTTIAGDGRSFLPLPAPADFCAGFGSFRTVSATPASPCSCRAQRTTIPAALHQSSSSSTCPSPSAPLHLEGYEDWEVMDWVSRYAPRDPMVELDPVTVLRRISRDREVASAATNVLILSSQIQKDEVKKMPRLLQTTGTPASPPIGMMTVMMGGRGNNLPSLASALFMLSLGAAAGLHFFTSSPRRWLLQTKPSSSSSSSTQKPSPSPSSPSTIKRQLIEKSLRISASIRSAMNIGAASLKASHINTLSVSQDNQNAPCSTVTSVEQFDDSKVVVSNNPDIRRVEDPICGASSSVDRASSTSQGVSVNAGSAGYEISSAHDHVFQFQNEAVIESAAFQRGLLAQCTPLIQNRSMVNESFLDSLRIETINECHHSQDPVLDTRDHHVTVTIKDCDDHEFSSPPVALSFPHDSLNAIVLKNFGDAKLMRDSAGASQGGQQDLRMSKENSSNGIKNDQDGSCSRKSELFGSGVSDKFEGIGQVEEMQHQTIPDKESLENSDEAAPQAYGNKQSSSDISVGSATPDTKSLTATINGGVQFVTVGIDAEVSDMVSKLGSERMLAAIVPALAVGIGSMGLLVGGGVEGLQIVGFTALASFICQDILLAQRRESLKRELTSITDRKKLREFLEQRNVIIKKN